MNNAQILLLWSYMTLGIWSTYYFKTLVSPIIYTIISLMFVIVFALVSEEEQ